MRQNTGEAHTHTHTRSGGRAVAVGLGATSSMVCVRRCAGARVSGCDVACACTCVHVFASVICVPAGLWGWRLDSRPSFTTKQAPCSTPFIGAPAEVRTSAGT